MPTTTASHSLRRRLALALVFPLSFVVTSLALLGVMTLTGHYVPGGPVSQSELGADADAIRAPVEGSPAYVLGQHRADCWTAAEQRSVLPSAAIVQRTGGRLSGLTIHTADAAIVDAAFSEVLNQLGFEAEPTTDRFRVIALCSR